MGYSRGDIDVLLEKIHRKIDDSLPSTHGHPPHPHGSLPPPDGWSGRKRFNQMLKLMLRKFTDKVRSEWCSVLLHALFSYRNIPQEATGFSLVELMLGRQPRGPLDKLKQEWENDKGCLENMVSYLQRTCNCIDLSRKLARRHEKASKVQMKWRYDRNACSHSFVEGDSDYCTGTHQQLHSNNIPCQDRRAHQSGKNLPHQHAGSVALTIGHLHDGATAVPSWPIYPENAMVHINPELMQIQTRELGELLEEHATLF